MSLTIEQKNKLNAVLKRTGAHRETGKAEKIVPGEYKKYQELVVRDEVLVEVPKINVPVTCYITTAADKIEHCPVHVNMHGGGFVFLQDQDDDMYCAHLAAKTRGIVVDIDYATSLEYPFPTAFEQCYRVVQWVFEQCKDWGADKRKVSMGGHSAGGCLSAAIALKAAKTKDFSVCLQVLDYAALDNYLAFQEGGAERSQAFSLFYADGDIDLLKDPYVSPAFATLEMMKGQPKTLIITAQNCPFCEINEEYGQKLIQAGTTVTIKRFRNSRHGFTVRLFDEWQESQSLIIEEIIAASK